MRKENINIDALMALLQAGLWEKDVRLEAFEGVDFQEVYRLAEMQAVSGIVLAGVENLPKEQRPTTDLLLQWIGSVQILEQKNKAMNQFIAELVGKMMKSDIFTLLVKGQGVGQCYERPLWRVSGDVDLFLCHENYEKAKVFLLPLSTRNKTERHYSKEMGFYIGNWLVEIHGTLRTGLSSRVDSIIDSVQQNVFYGGNVRTWMNDKMQVFLPATENDIFFVFTHFLKHFYKEGGVTLRQMCDWSRLIWTYRNTLNRELLQSWVEKAGLMSEWRAFAAFSIDYLGMPKDSMPMYDSDRKWNIKARRILSFVLKIGEWRKYRDTFNVARIFPYNTLKFCPGIILNANWMKVKERMSHSHNQ